MGYRILKQKQEKDHDVVDVSQMTLNIITQSILLLFCRSVPRHIGIV